MNNYPAGAANDPNAPWNQSDPEPIETNVYVTATLSKSATIEVCDYEENRWMDCEPDDEGGISYSGGVEYDTSCCDLTGAYKEQEYPIPELLDELVKFLKKSIAENKELISDINKEIASCDTPRYIEEAKHRATLNALISEKAKWENMLTSAQGWTVDELEVEND